MRRRLSRASEPSALWRTFGRLLPVLAAAFIFTSPFTIQAQAQDYLPLEGLRVSEGGGVQYRAGFLSLSAGPGRCIYLSNSNLSGVVYTIHQSKWQRRTGSTWVDIPGTESEEGGLCGYSATSPGEYRVVAEISIDGERGYYSSENTLTVEGEAPSGGTGTIGTESFSIPDRGGWSTTSSGTAETPRVGYGRIRADAGSTTPSGIAIFQFRDSQGVLISEAGVPATEPVLEGRIFAEVDGPVNTGLAIANPNDETATIDFYFTDTDGTSFSYGTVQLDAHQQTAKFLNQPPFNSGGSPVRGTFTFESSVPIAVIALRGFTNEAGEFLMTTLPVASLSSASEETVYIPHFAAGGGWVTQVILVNPTDSTITGTVGFLGPGSDTTAASPVILTLDDGSTGSNFDYLIPPRSSQRFTTSNPYGTLNSGSVRATPNSGNAAPSGLVVFSYAPAGKTLSEAGVPALAKGSGFRVYAEASGTLGQMGSISTGLAITNAADTSNTVTLEVTNLDGSLAVAPATLALPPSGQVARFLNDIFSLPDNFFGVLRVTSTADVAIVALRLRVNAKREIKVTTLAPSNEMDPATSAETFFPHIADSGGWSTQFILFSGAAGQASSGTLTFIDASGQPLDLSVLPSVEIPASDAPDLVVQTPSVSDSSPNTGETFTLSATVRNQGNGLSASTTLRYYRSPDATISTGDMEVGTDAVGTLAAGGTSSSVLTLTAPSTAGTYYYGACVDRVSGESDTGNNCSNSRAVTVQSDPRAVTLLDANLRAAIEAALGKASNAPITRDEMASLTFLEVREKGISDLTGLETATNLETLWLSSNNIADISALAGLSKLTRLGLQVNSIADISALSGLTNLTFLKLGFNNRTLRDYSITPTRENSGIVDLSPLAGLTNLRVLELQYNSITDISALLGLTNLRHLILSGNDIEDISALSGLTNLRNLYLSDNDIEDISALSGLTNLGWLYLDVNYTIADLSPLAGLTNLGWLYLGVNTIADLSPLAGLTKLERLRLRYNDIEDISALSGLTNLATLDLSYNDIEDISALSGLTNLATLRLRYNDIEDISALSGLTNLGGLYLGVNTIADLSPLAGLTKLATLRLRYNDIEDISALSGLTNLATLNLSDNDIEDISALSGLTNLATLNLWFNKVTDISSLRGLTNLAELELRWNPLNDSSLDDHIPALESRGVAVFFTPKAKGDFDIELVFLDSFTEDQKYALRLAAQRWMSVIAEDLPDYEFTEAWSAQCGGHSYTIPAGERIDDLRIYMTTFDVDDYPNAVGLGGPSLLRETTYLPVLGCMGFDVERANLIVTGLHEVGHVLGFGTVWDELGFIRDLSRNDSNADTHFNGPLAIAAFNDAGGSSYMGKKVPVQKMDGAHWRYSVLKGDVMGPGGGGALSAITVQSLADLGYGVDVTQADAYSVSTAAASLARDRGFAIGDGRLSERLAIPTRAEPKPWCGLDGDREPIYIVDQQGRGRFRNLPASGS